MLNMTQTYKKYRENKVMKGIWLTQEESELWDPYFIRDMLNGKMAVLNNNTEYVKQLEEIIRHLILSETTTEEDEIIGDIIGTSEQVR